MTGWRDDRRVALVRDRAAYCRTPPFDPSEAYPEWSGVSLAPEDNPGFRAVRNLLAALELDRAGWGTPAWNPLGDLIRPGDVVAIKPNLVYHVNLAAPSGGTAATDPLVTHGSVIRAVLDYVGRALDGRGMVILGDCPIQDADWTALTAVVGLDPIAKSFRERFPGVSLRIQDYRRAHAVSRGAVMVRRVADERDTPSGEEVDLGAASLLAPLADGRVEFGVSRYPRYRMRRAHGEGRHLYLLARDLLYADVMINLPKMKSHMKAGVTCALKNFVGINSHKDYLPHFRYGSPKHGGDEYPDGNWFWDLMWYFRHHDWDRDAGVLKLAFFGLGTLCKQLLPLLAHVPKENVAMGGGGWHGNDTLWRTVLDVNRAYFYFDAGRRAVTPDAPVRRYLAILDGLMGGDRESPLAPSAVAGGVMLAARNPVALDAVATALMGFDIDKIPQIREAFALADLTLASFGPGDVTILGDEVPGTIDGILRAGRQPLFNASRGYRGHVEYRPTVTGGREPEFAGSLAEPELLAE